MPNVAYETPFQIERFSKILKSKTISNWMNRLSSKDRFEWAKVV